MGTDGVFLLIKEKKVILKSTDFSLLCTLGPLHTYPWPSLPPKPKGHCLGQEPALLSGSTDVPEGQLVTDPYFPQSHGKEEPRLPHNFNLSV